MIERSCNVCAQPLRNNWFTRLLPWQRCRDESACAFRLYVQSTEPPPPIDYEPEPEDAWVCSNCQGKGEYPAAQDFETGAIRMEKCPRCERTKFEVEPIGLSGSFRRRAVFVSNGVEPGYSEPVS